MGAVAPRSAAGGVGGTPRGGCPRPHRLSLPTGWKLNPVVGAVYGPEFYAGNVTSGPASLWVPPNVGPTPCPTLPSSPRPLSSSCTPACAAPLAPASLRGCVPAGHGAEAGSGTGCPAVAAGGPSRALRGAAAESPRLFPPSRSNGVPVPRHGDGRGLPRGTLTGTRTRRLQHLPGCAAATAHPHLRRVSTRAAAGTACLGAGGSFAAASLRFCCRQRRHCRALALRERAAAPPAPAWPRAL